MPKTRAQEAAEKRSTRSRASSDPGKKVTQPHRVQKPTSPRKPASARKASREERDNGHARVGDKRSTVEKGEDAPPAKKTKTGEQMDIGGYQVGAHN